MKLFSEQLREVLNSCGLPSARLAKHADINPQLMRNFLLDKAGLSIESIDKVGLVLDLRIAIGGLPDLTPQIPSKKVGRPTRKIMHRKSQVARKKEQGKRAKP